MFLNNSKIVYVQGQLYNSGANFERTKVKDLIVLRKKKLSQMLKQTHKKFTYIPINMISNIHIKK